MYTYTCDCVSFIVSNSYFAYCLVACETAIKARTLYLLGRHSVNTPSYITLLISKTIINISL